MAVNLVTSNPWKTMALAAISFTISFAGIMSGNEGWGEVHLRGRLHWAAVLGASPHRPLQPFPLPKWRLVCGSAGEGAV